MNIKQKRDKVVEYKQLIDNLNQTWTTTSDLNVTIGLEYLISLYKKHLNEAVNEYKLSLNK
jgi:hypothetical protein